MRNKYYMVAGLILVVAAIGGYIYFKSSPSQMERFVAERPNERALKISQQVNIATDSRPSERTYYCPKPEDLVKQELKWGTSDGRWNSYTPSSASKIVNFIGAQWIGIKVGKVICLYKTDEAVSFPVALEQTRSQLILEPHGTGWSALVKNRRFCKSASTADCPYHVERPQDITNVYEEIQYNPTVNN